MVTRLNPQDKLQDPNQNSPDILKRFATSLGAMSTVLSYFTDLDVLKLQQMSVWHYQVNLPRLQRRIGVFDGQMTENFYYGHNGNWLQCYNTE